MKQTFIIAALLTIGTLTTQAQELRIGYVDRQALINAMPQTAEIEKKYQADLALYNAEYNRMENEYHQKVKEYMKHAKEMKDALKMALQTEITEYEERLATFKLRYMKELENERSKGYNDIEQTVQNAIKKVAEMQQISIVFDKTTPLYADELCTDITQQVKNELKTK
ncbi:MAG: OmpH family outer membrane protein [Paludibacteraceae bacterium]